MRETCSSASSNWCGLRKPAIVNLNHCLGICLSERRKCQPLANTRIYFSRSTVMHVSPALTGVAAILTRCRLITLRSTRISMSDRSGTWPSCQSGFRTRIRGPAPIGTQRAQRQITSTYNIFTSQSFNLNTHSVDSFPFPGDAQFPLNAHYASPPSRADVG